MSRRKTGQQKLSELPRRRKPRVIIAVAIVLGLFAAWTLLAYSGALDSVFRQKNKEGGRVSTASFNSNSPSKEYIYAGGRLVATEEPTSGGGCGAGPGTPGQPTATAVFSGSVATVAISWTPSSGSVDHYQVERKQTLSDSGYQVVKDNVPPAPAPSTTDDSVSVNTAYVYRIRAFDAAGCPSAYSGIDLATTVFFHDDPLQSRLTIIKAQHISEVRQAVDAVRATANLGAANWTNPLDKVKATHFSELRERLNDALPSLGFSTIPPDSGIAQSSIVYASHLQAVRDKVK